MGKTLSIWFKNGEELHFENVENFKSEIVESGRQFLRFEFGDTYKARYINVFDQDKIAGFTLEK